MQYEFRRHKDLTPYIVAIGIALALAIGLSFAALTGLPHGDRAPMTAQHDVRAK